MTSLNSSLYIGLTGIRTSRIGLNVTGNNIANVNTEGYSRQRPDTVLKGTVVNEGITVGTGSDITRIQALRDQLANRALTDAETAFRFQDRLAKGLQEMEGILADGEGVGIGPALSNFFDGLEKVTQRPNDLSSRQELLVLGETLTAELNSRDRELSREQQSIDFAIEDSVQEINDLTSRIANLNSRIASLSKPAEDLIDERQKAIDRLGELVGVEVYEITNNQVQVNLKGSSQQILVGLQIRNELGVVNNPANAGFKDVTLQFGSGSINITGAIETGELAANLQLRDVEIQTVKRELDRLAGGLIVQFNAIHQTGTDLGGNTNLRFFDPGGLGPVPVGTVDPDRYLGLAGSIRLADDLRTTPGGPLDPSRLALSASGATGDNAVGLQLAALRNDPNVVDQDLDGDPSNDPNRTFEQFFNSITADLGSATRSAEDLAATQDALLYQAQIRRDAVSGVELNEEAANLTQYQRAFEASSRFLNVINQLTGDIIARLGG